MADTQSVAQAEAALSKASANEKESKAALDAAQTTYNDLQAKKVAAEVAYRDSGAGTSSPEYKAYQAARSAATDAKSAYQDAQSIYEADVLSKAQAADALTAAQKTTDTASSQTAADRVADKTASAPTTTNNYYVTNNGANSTVTETKTGAIVYAGSYDSAVSQSAELNRQSSDAYNQTTSVKAKEIAATQNTGTDSSANGPALTTEEKKQVNKAPLTVDNERAIVPAPAAKPPAINPNTSEDSGKFVPKAPDPKQVGGPKAVANQTRPNPLNDNASYTYSLNLHVLTKEDYHAMIDNPASSNWRPSKNLISEANRYTKNRDINFADDFYFDSLKLSTVIGLNHDNRGTNAIMVGFTIIEPYGMTLLDRIIDINTQELGIKNYLEAPYLLEINFFGYDDQGRQAKLSSHTKWIPIKLVSFKIKASIKGAEYAIEAVPFNHQAQFETLQAIKTKFEVTAGTVKEYFENTLDDASKASVEDSVRATRPTTSSAPDEVQYDEQGNVIGTRAPADASGSAKKGSVPSVKTKSFTAAYNAWNEAEVRNGNANFADRIRFKIHPDIENSKIVDPSKNDVKDAPGTTAKDASKGNSNNSATPADTVNLASTVHSLNQGTTVKSVINMVISQSEYILNQVKDTATQGGDKSQDSDDKDKKTEKINPFNLFKIIPKIELGDYDEELGRWGKIVTYYIKKYKAYNNRDSRVEKSLPPKAVKDYQYMYTGHNTDVINFDIDFNALYFTAINVDKGKTSATNIAKTTDENKNKDGRTSTNNNGNIQPEKREMVAGTQQTSTGGALKRSATVNSASVIQGFYTSAAGDMINVKLQITGDPEFIKQDDLFILPDDTRWNTNDEEDPQYVTGSTSLNMDSGEIFCNLTFKTPRDFNDKTGRYLDTSGKYSVSKFSGYYKVIKVDSEFRGGKFTQTLDLVRYPNQADPVNPDSKTKNVETTRKQDEDKKQEKSSNSQVPKSAVAQAPAPAIVPPAPAADQSDAETARLNRQNSAPPAVIAADPPAAVEDKKLAAVAEKGETKAIADASSADGNIVAVQTVDTKAADAAAEKTKASTEITAIQSENNALLAQSQELANKNKALQSQKDSLESDLAAKDPTYDTLSYSQIQAKYPEVAALQNQQTQNRAQIDSNTAAMTANANKALTLARNSGLGASIEYTQGRSDGGVLGQNIPIINLG